MDIQFLCNLHQAYQISLSKNQSSIFGDFFHLIFMTLCDNLLKNIDDDFLKFNCGLHREHPSIFHITKIDL